MHDFRDSLVNYHLTINYWIEAGLSMKVLKLQGLQGFDSAGRGEMIEKPVSMPPPLRDGCFGYSNFLK
jgi:hypothetical protein